MENVWLFLILDITIAVLLCVTIAYVVRLSGHLKKFKKNRDELKTVIENLADHITKAEKAVEDLHHAADEAGHDLQSRLNKANNMFDELDMVVQTGDSLANRLEELAVKNRKIINGGEGDLSNLAELTGKKQASYDARVENLIRDIDEQKGSEDPSQMGSPFAIRDPEIERDGSLKPKADGFTMKDNDVLSDAERDLYDTLQKNKKLKRGQ